MARSDRDTSRLRRYLARVRAEEAPEIETPAHGSNSEVYLLSAPDQARCVVRAFARPSAAARYARLLERFGRRELPLPELLWSDAAWSTWLRFGRCFCAERLVEGPLLLQLRSEGAIGAALQALARLHDELSPGWGAPERLQHGDLRPQLRAEVLRCLRELPDSGPWVEAGDKLRWKALLDASWEALPPIESFSLLHGKIGADDVVLTQAASRAVFVDVESLHFGHFAHDLYYLLDVAAPEDDPLRAKLIERYLSLRRALPSSYDFALESAFFAPRHHLRKLWLAHRRARGEALAADKRARLHCGRLRELAARA